MQHIRIKQAAFILMFLAGAAAVVLFPMESVHAAVEPFVPEVPIPGTDFSSSLNVDNDLFGKYVRAIYIYFIWVVGIVATFMIIYAGVKWVAAAGDPGRIRDAREIINNAIIGVVIGLTSVVLLNLLSPNFTTLSIPGTTSVTQKYFEGALVTRICDPVRDGNEAQLQCGNVKKIGTKEDRNGKPQDEFCLGTLCGNTAVCEINYNPATKIYGRGNGCTSRIPVAPNTNPTFQTVDHIRTSSTKGECSLLRKTSETWFVDLRCGKPERSNDLSGCFMIGTQATIIGTDEPDTAVRNMYCPETPQNDIRP